LLFVGDCKMSALENRARIVSGEHFYLSPLPQTGGTAQEMPEWIDIGLDKARKAALEQIYRENDRGQKVLAAGAYEFERRQSAVMGEETVIWQERVFMVCSPAHAEQQERGLEKRLVHARQKIEALTPKVGRGKRQIREEETLTASIDRILREQRVEGLLRVDYEKECETRTCYVGKGRGSANRERKVVEKIRYRIKAVERNEEAISETIQRFGWKAFVSNAADSALSLNDAVLCYRNEYRIERIFNRLKSRLNIAPLFVKCDEQIEGLTCLLTLGVRVLTLIEFVIRRSLQAENAKLAGCYLGNPKKETDKPTAEAILKAFSTVTLTIIQDTVGNQLLRRVTPLSERQVVILNRLGLTNVYSIIQNSA